MKEWCWSWNSNTLATWCDELTHWKRPWCWETLRAGGEEGNRGWDGWMATLTQWTWVLVDSGSLVTDREAWRAAVHGVAKSQTRLSNWTELNWKPLSFFTNGRTGKEITIKSGGGTRTQVSWLPPLPFNLLSNGNFWCVCTNVCGGAGNDVCLSVFI